MIKFIGNTKISKAYIGNNKLTVEEDKFKDLVAGNEMAGFFGEIPATELIRGDELATLIGLTAGISINSNSNWLKFAYEGQILYYPKLSHRYGISHNQILATGVVYGDKIIEIKGKEYKTMLMRGTNQADPKVVNTQYSGTGCHNSMWNKLMLPIHIKASTKTWGQKDNVESTLPNWNIGYTDADLGVGAGAGNGAYVWCQESVGVATGRLVRGYIDISGVGYGHSTGTDSAHGFRLCLIEMD